MAIQLPQLLSFVRVISTEEMKVFWPLLIEDMKTARPKCRFLIILCSWKVGQFSIEQAHDSWTSATSLMNVHNNVISCRHYADHCHCLR
jgi:hypothetical protein